MRVMGGVQKIRAGGLRREAEVSGVGQRGRGVANAGGEHGKCMANAGENTGASWWATRENPEFTVSVKAESARLPFPFHGSPLSCASRSPSSTL